MQAAGYRCSAHNVVSKTVFLINLFKGQAHFPSTSLFFAKKNRFTFHHRSTFPGALGARRTFHMIHMVDMNVPEHRRVTQLALSAPGGPNDYPDQASRQPDYGIVMI